MKIGNLCPECGEAGVVNEEGCPGEYAQSAMLVGLVSARLNKKVTVTFAKHSRRKSLGR